MLLRFFFPLFAKQRGGILSGAKEGGEFVGYTLCREGDSFAGATNDSAVLCHAVLGGLVLCLLSKNKLIQLSPLKT